MVLAKFGAEFATLSLVLDGKHMMLKLPEEKLAYVIETAMAAWVKIRRG